MMKQTLNLRFSFIAFAVAGVTLASANIKYIFTQIDVPGASRTIVRGTDGGIIVGSAIGDQVGGFSALIVDHKPTVARNIYRRWTPYNTHYAGELTGIGCGCVVGVINRKDGGCEGFVETEAGRVTKLPHFGPIVKPQAINDYGTIVGSFADALDSNKFHGFIYRKSGVQVMDYPEAVSTELYGVTLYGFIGGTYTDINGVSHGFTWYRGHFTPYDVPGASSTFVRGVNTHGDIVGGYIDASRDDNIHGFKVVEGVLSRIDYPGARDTIILGIDEFEQLCGSFDGMTHGFVTTHARDYRRNGSLNPPFGDLPF